MAIDFQPIDNSNTSTIDFQPLDDKQQIQQKPSAFDYYIKNPAIKAGQAYINDAKDIGNAVTHPADTFMNMIKGVTHPVDTIANTIKGIPDMVMNHPLQTAAIAIPAAAGAEALGKIGMEGISGSTIKNAFDKTVHGEEFLKGQAKNLRDVGSGIEDALHKAYGDFYSENNLANVPLDSSKVDSIFLENDLPKSTIQKIDNQIGKVDTVGKAHQARQIIRSDLSRGAFNKDSINLTVEDIKKESMSDLKDLMRRTTEPVNPEATAKLQELDKYAYEKAYPTLLRINRLVSSDPLATEYPDTTGILSLFKSGLGKGQVRKLFSDSPERIKQLDSYLDSPEYKQDVNKAVDAASKFAKGMKDFRNREVAKKVGYGVAGAAGIAGTIKKLFGI